jgi:3',5'-cyclic AMP phosphodiesterase CpdA
MFRLAHISDIHLGPLPDVSYRELASKRITGYINWRRNRKGQLNEDALDTIVGHMRTAAPDHLAVTGDLMNLALKAEVEISTLWLETLGDPNEVSVVPGNHDAYVPGALDKACAAWGRWMHGDGEAEPARKGTFPYMRVRGPIAIIGVSSARATAPFLASGFFGSTQAHRAAAMLDEARRRGLFRVVLIHHPPVRGATSSHKRLYGIGRFQRMLRSHGAELVLHGHTHLPTLYQLEGHEGEVPVVGVTPTGQLPAPGRAGAHYNIFDLAEEDEGWSLRLSRHGLTEKGETIELVHTQDIRLRRPHAAHLNPRA